MPLLGVFFLNMLSFNNKQKKNETHCTRNTSSKVRPDTYLHLSPKNQENSKKTMFEHYKCKNLSNTIYFRFLIEV